MCMLALDFLQKKLTQIKIDEYRGTYTGKKKWTPIHFDQLVTQPT